MPRFTKDFRIRYDSKADKFVMVWPKWFMSAMHWKGNIKLNYYINPNTGEITFSQNIKPGIIKYFAVLEEYMSHKNKKEYKKILEKNKKREFNNLLDKDKEYLFYSSKENQIKRDMEDIKELEKNPLKWIELMKEQLSTTKDKSKRKKIKRELKYYKDELKILEVKKIFLKREGNIQNQEF